MSDNTKKIIYLCREYAVTVAKLTRCGAKGAKVVEFFSFGTNDLTQMTLGFSRDDIAKFLPVYLDKGILKNDPFQILDRNGVGQLIREAVFKGRSF